jgi:hypothetical protein
MKRCPKNRKTLLVEQPRETFQQILSAFFEKKWTALVEKTAIDSSEVRFQQPVTSAILWLLKKGLL